MATGTLKRLGAETFGQRLRRARHESGVNLRDAADLISREVTFVSHTSLFRLEDFNQPPADRKRRQLACLTVLVYGYEPADFGLDVAALPGSVDLDKFLNSADQMRPKHEATTESTSEQGESGYSGNPMIGAPRAA